MNTSALLRAGSRDRAPGSWARICPAFSAVFVLFASFALGACSSEDSAKGSGTDPIGNNSNENDACEARGDCAEPSGGSDSPDSWSTSSGDSEDSGTWGTDEACIDLRIFSEAFAGENSMDCSTKHPDGIQWVTSEPDLSDNVAHCFEAALSAGHGAYAFDHMQSMDYRVGHVWVVTPEGELHSFWQEPLGVNLHDGVRSPRALHPPNVYRHQCGSFASYPEGSKCVSPSRTAETLCYYGVLVGAPCDTDDDCRSPLICNLESQRCDQRCLSSECLYPDSGFR